MKRVTFSAALAAILLTSLPVRASVLDIVGPGITGTSNISSNTSLWSLVQNVTVPSDKNAILRDYVVAKSSNGSVSVFSLGEISPDFGGPHSGSPTLAPYVASSGSSLSLIDPNANASGRNLTDLTSLQVFSLAKQTGSGGLSSTLTLSGLVTSPGVFTAPNLASLSNKTLVTTNPSVTYGGTSLFSFINPSNHDSTSQIVITLGSDGYMVVLSLAELDPSLGGDPNILLATSQTTGTFPGVARTIIPGDNKHGRWESNLVSIEVASAVPEPTTWVMMILGFGGVGFIACRRRRFDARETLHAS
jgi:hypothetical protein